MLQPTSISITYLEKINWIFYVTNIIEFQILQNLFLHHNTHIVSYQKAECSFFLPARDHCTLFCFLERDHSKRIGFSCVNSSASNFDHAEVKIQNNSLLFLQKKRKKEKKYQRLVRDAAQKIKIIHKKTNKSFFWFYKGKIYISENKLISPPATFFHSEILKFINIHWHENFHFSDSSSFVK